MREYEETIKFYALNRRQIIRCADIYINMYMKGTKSLDEIREKRDKPFKAGKKAGDVEWKNHCTLVIAAILAVDRIRLINIGDKNDYIINQ